MIGKALIRALGAAVLLAGSAWFALAQQGPAPAGADPAAALPITFTAEQALAGRGAYSTYCVTCHGDGPPSVPGPYRTTVGQLFSFVSSEMPQDAPGSLPRQTYVSIIAYFLQNTGYPAGAEPLPDDPALLSRMSLAR